MHLYQVLLTGHTALMKAIRDMGARAGKEKDLTIECQVGSEIALSLACQDSL